MEYVVCLKKEMELFSEQEAQQRYLELVAMGYKEKDILLAAPVPVQIHLNMGKNTGTQANPAMYSGVDNGFQNTTTPGYPMSMHSYETQVDQNATMTMATDSAGYEPVQTGMDMSLFRNTGELESTDELPSDTIS
ncbi:hypothetical protein Desdi_2148 [Desulfitobacterium dichloroeliminans LMG P-21439]|uniref:Uncharacterized protein n=2 Tax=Desulfitobacterium dichloroeliminans TaxID=233055 RepID=L0F6Z7_DESDL|nr:hypothetical protein Desdi_2148 [Desulfitobacterium dichloroeliminans LMG P-21439]